MELRDKNIYIDSNRKRGKFETRYISSHEVSYLFLSSIAFYVFDDSDIFSIR